MRRVETCIENLQVSGPARPLPVPPSLHSRKRGTPRRRPRRAASRRRREPRWWRGAVPTSAWILRPGLTSARASRSLRGALRRAPRSGQSSPDRRARAAAETPGCVLRALVGAPPGRRSQRPAPKASAATRPQGGTVPAAWAVRQATSHVRTTGNHWVSGQLAPAAPETPAILRVGGQPSLFSGLPT